MSGNIAVYSVPCGARYRPWRLSIRRRPARSPDPARRFVHHGLALPAGESLLKFRHVRKRPVHTEPRQGVRVGGDLVARGLWTLIRAPTERIREEEALARRETVGFRRVQRLALRLVDVLQRQHCQMDAAVVGSIFASGQLALLRDAVLGNFLRVLGHDALVFLVITLRIFGGPPIAQVSLGVELATLVVEAVDRFVADDHAGGTQIGSVVLIEAEQREL